MHPKDADGMANSVDPDQTASSEAVWSWSALFAKTYLSQYIEFVRYFFGMGLLFFKIINLAELLVFLGVLPLKSSWKPCFKLKNWMVSHR